MTWQAAAIEVGARPFAAMIEKTDVVVLALERLDLLVDESVQLAEISFDISGNSKVHSFLLRRSGYQRGVPNYGYERKRFGWCARGNLTPNPFPRGKGNKIILKAPTHCSPVSAYGSSN